LKLEFHDADTDTDTDILARILADTPDARFPEVILMASSTTRRHSREDFGEEVRVGVGVRVGTMECQLNVSHSTHRWSFWRRPSKTLRRWRRHVALRSASSLPRDAVLAGYTCDRLCLSV